MPTLETKATASVLGKFKGKISGQRAITTRGAVRAAKWFPLCISNDININDINGIIKLN